MLINIFDLNKKVDLNQKNQKNHDFFKKVMIFASPVFELGGRYIIMSYVGDEYDDYLIVVQFM